MKHYVFRNLASGYREVILDIIDSKNSIRNHMGHVKEIYNVSFEMSGLEPILFCNHRSYNPAFMYAESLWNLTGDINPWLCDYNPKYKQYFKKGPLLAGYGNRLFNYPENINQIDHLVKYLKSDTSDTSLPFVCSMGIPEDIGSLFNPCITQYDFLKRNGRLYMSTQMRSQDMSWGFPYDINICISFLNLISLLSGTPIGRYTHFCDVARLYLDNNISDVINLQASNETYSLQKYLFTQEDIKQIPLAKNIIAEMTHEFCLSSINRNITPYWKDAISVCYAYKNIRIGKNDTALTCLKEYTSEKVREQFMVWINARP